MTLAKINQKFPMITIANYCLIAYAFLLPLSAKMASKVLIPIVLCLFLSNEFKERLIFIVKNRIFQSFLLMLATYALWILGSEHTVTALFELQKLFKVFSILVIIAMVLKQEFSFKIMQGFVLAMLLSAILSYAMFLHISLPAFISQQLTGENVPFMMNYTQYATTLNIVIGFLLYQCINNHSIKLMTKILYAASFIIIFGNLFLIGSRLGYFLFFASTITILLLVYKTHIKKIIFVTLIVSLSCYGLIYITVPSFQGRVQHAITDIQKLNNNDLTTALGARVGLFLYSIDFIKKYPIFGLGTGDHVYAVRQNILEHEENPTNVSGILSNIPDAHGSNLHNQFLDLLLQFGIIGFIVFLNIFYQIYKSRPQQTFLRPLPYILIVNILIACFANPLFIYGDVERIFILLVALLIVPFEQTTLKEQEQKNIHAI